MLQGWGYELAKEEFRASEMGGGPWCRMDARFRASSPGAGGNECGRPDLIGAPAVLLLYGAFRPADGRSPRGDPWVPG